MKSLPLLCLSFLFLAACNSTPKQPEHSLLLGQSQQLNGTFKLNNPGAPTLLFHFYSENQLAQIMITPTERDTLYKRYKIIGNKLFIQHDMEHINSAIKQEREMGNEINALWAEKLTSKNQTSDVYEVISLQNDSIILKKKNRPYIFFKTHKSAKNQPNL
ncbi:hypothetical protein PEDI_23380 [Persicobacter diffluens]|uniref:Lipoprotein n=1 Tax=Persicobacter diffluens TaxID=981 RepID=A0AAN4VZ78_9BACT|nr:hypothetical protein PEDI_23380 [Persicobacter diffluens]